MTDTNVNTLTCESLVDTFTTSISSHLDEWLEGVDVVYIEQQPMGLRAFNVKTKVLSHVLQALCRLQNKKVEFISPKKKLNDAGQTMTYAQNKKHAIQRTRDTIDPVGREILERMILEKKKTDDVCDAFLQGVLSASPSHTVLSFDVGMKHLGIWKGTVTTTNLLLCHTIFPDTDVPKAKLKAKSLVATKRKRAAKNAAKIEEISSHLDPFLL